MDSGFSNMPRKNVLLGSAVSFLMSIGTVSLAAELDEGECAALREFVFAASDVVESAAAIVRFSIIGVLEHYLQNLGNPDSERRINETTDLTARHNASVDTLTRAMDGLRPLVDSCR